MNNRHPWTLKKSKSWGPFWSYQLNSTANSAHFARFLGKLAVLFTWYVHSYVLKPLRSYNRDFRVNILSSEYK